MYYTATPRSKSLRRLHLEDCQHVRIVIPFLVCLTFLATPLHTKKIFGILTSPVIKQRQVPQSCQERVDGVQHVINICNATCNLALHLLLPQYPLCTALGLLCCRLTQSICRGSARLPYMPQTCVILVTLCTLAHNMTAQSYTAKGLESLLLRMPTEL